LEKTEIKVMNIFICQTPFQLFYAKEIINHFTVANSVENTSLVFHSNLNLIPNDTANKIEYFNLGNERGVLNRFIRFKKAKNKVDKIIRTPAQNISIFIPHTSGVLTNYIFNLKNTFDNKKVSLNLFYEGILYLYDYQEHFQRHHINRFLLGLLLGFIYRRDKIILPKDSEKVKHIYTPIKKFTTGDRSKTIELPFEQKSPIEINPNQYLILGGPVVFLRKFYEDCIRQIAKSSNQDFIIYYKGHSSFETHYTQYKTMFHEIASKHKVNYVLLSSNEPIESLIEQIKPSVIYSYYSSALLNISLMFPNNFKIICYLDEHNPHFKMFKSIFNHFNIKTVFVN